MFVHDGLLLYFWARPAPTTAHHVEENSKVSFAIDEYVNDWNKAKGIQGDGTCDRISDGDEIARAIELFADKFPSPSSGASTTNLSFFKIRPSSLQFIDNSGSRIEISDQEFGVDFHREQVLAAGGESS